MAGRPKRQKFVEKQDALNPFELEQSELTRYEPVYKAICGRLWTDVLRQEWKDHKGKTYPSGYFKLFLWAGEEKYRCTILFEAANEAAARLKKGDWVVCFGLDDLVQAAKSGKRYHNFRVVKLWILPDGNSLFDIKGLLGIGKQLLIGYQEMQKRMELLEAEIKRLGGNVPEPEPIKNPYGDKDKAKKNQSLRRIVGDIYIDTED